LGGNVILKYLGQKGENVPKEIAKAAVVSVPYDLEKSAHNLDRGFNREVYAWSMLKHLKARTFEKAKRFPDDINFEKVKDINTFQAYDREITARLNGFQDERDYWAQSSSMNYLEPIKISTLLIHAANDPFLPEKDLPVESIHRSPHLKFILTPDGGHLGFISGNIPFHSDKWLEPTIIGFFKDE
jgi:predicted alpha/beta-fold hydrolase